MPASSSRFPTTRRSAILATGSDDPAERGAAWDAVIAAYWKPVYKYVRLRWQRDPADAEDAVQGFFARVLEKDYFAAYDAEKGTFRTWLRTCLDGYLWNAGAAAKRERRGGGRVESMDFAAAESELPRYLADPAHSPEELFYREWQRQIFALAIDDLRRECAASGRGTAFAVFERYDLALERSRYEDLAGEFGLPVTTVTNHLAAMRRALRRAVLARVRETTASRREFAREARALLGESGA
jgi:RNA polymerase sigma factor (sigma-70 family)